MTDRRRHLLGSLVALVALTVLLVSVATWAGAAGRASQKAFTFTNNEGQAVNDLHIEFGQAVKGKCRFGIFPNVQGQGTNVIDFSGSTIAAGASVQCGFRSSANRITIRQWWWTLDGQQVGTIKQGCQAPDCTSP